MTITSAKNAGSNGGNDQSAQAQQSAGTASPGATATQEKGRGWSFHQRGSFGRAPLSRGIGSESLTKLVAALALEYKETSEEYDVSLLTLDNENESTYFSCIIICVKDRLHPSPPTVSTHTLILAATANQLAPKNEPVNGLTVEVFRVPGDAYDQKLIDKIKQRVSQSFQGHNILSSTVTVVPVSFNVDDKVAVRHLAANSGLAASTELEIRRPNFVDVNLDGNTDDSKLQVQLSFSRQTIENVVGEPVRADIGINFTSQQTRFQAQNSVNSEDRSSTVSSLTGFIDLIYSPVAPQQGMFGAYAQPTQFGPNGPTTQLYVPRLVITSSDTEFASTPAAQLLSYLASMSVSADGNWMQALRPAPRAGSGIDMQDIGFVTMELPTADGTPGKKIDTGADQFRPENLGQLISAAIRPGLVISWDIPDAGPEKWYLDLFAMAASGDAGAVQAIYTAAQALTNGHFGRLYNPAHSMFVDTGNRIHNGYYTDRNGDKRDIRDIGYLAMGNLVGVTDLVALRDWSDTFVSNRYPLPQRLAARRRMIANVVNDAVFTGFSTRITFSTEFNTALSQAARDAGLVMTISTPMNSGDLNNARGVAGFVNEAMMPMAMAPVFTQDMGQGAGFGNQGYGGAFNSGRW